MPFFLHSISLSLILLFVISIRQSSAQKDNSPNCSCYRTGGDSSASFLYHRFYDFRNISSSPSNDYLKPPTAVPAEQQNGNEPPTADYFTSSSFMKDWAVQNYRSNATTETPTTMVRSAQNIYSLRDGPSSPTYLTLRTTRLPNFQSTAEMETNLKNIYHASIRIRARISGDPGACVGLFTFQDDQNESDIEILTRDKPSAFHATNQPSSDKDGKEVPGASSAVPVPKPGASGNGSWTDWVEYRIDWLEGKSVWYVGDAKVASKTYGVPKKESQFIMNVWSNGGTWTGNMTEGGSATMNVEWVDMFYNTSGIPPDVAAKPCDVTCKVDGLKAVGYPEVTSSAADIGRRGVAWFGWLGLAWVML